MPVDPAAVEVRRRIALDRNHAGDRSTRSAVVRENTVLAAQVRIAQMKRGSGNPGAPGDGRALEAGNAGLVERPGSSVAEPQAGSGTRCRGRKHTAPRFEVAAASDLDAIAHDGGSNGKGGRESGEFEAGDLRIVQDQVRRRIEPAAVGGDLVQGHQFAAYPELLPAADARPVAAIDRDDFVDLEFERTVGDRSDGGIDHDLPAVRHRGDGRRQAAA